MKIKKHTEKIIKDLKKSLITEFGDNINSVILFGSQAQGKANEFSDYDFLIILKNQYDWKLKNKISDICYEIDLKYDILTDIHVISDYELNDTLRGCQTIFRNALKNGIYA